MALCSVADVRTYCSPVSVTDANIEDIIDIVSTEILLKADSTDETNKYLVQAGIHAAVAVTMKKARSNGELAAGISVEGYSQQNTGLIEEIKGHENDSEMFIQKYISKNTSASSWFGSGRMGYGTVNQEL